MLKGFGRYGLNSVGKVRTRETASVSGSGLSRRFTEKASGGANNSTAMALGGITHEDLILSYIGGTADSRANQSGYQIAPDYYRYCGAVFREDGVCGAAVELRSNIPYSDFRLTNMRDQKRLQKYNQAIGGMRLNSLMRRVAIDRDVMGAFFGVLDWNPADKVFDSMLPLSRLDVRKILYSPVHGLDPVVDIELNPMIADLLASTDQRAAEIKKCIPSFMQQGNAKGQGIPVPMDSIVWIARPGPDQRFNSIFHRILYIFLIERALIRGTIEGAHRRQKPILHLTLGQGDDWIPTPEEMDSVSSLFIDADADPLGAVVATRDGISVNEVRNPQDFWKITDISDQTTPIKLRTLGLSEAFLSSDASFANAEAAMSVFMENARAERDQTTEQLFYDKLFPTIGAAAGFYLTAKEMDARANERGTLNAVGNVSKIDMPTLQWVKSLQPEGDAAYIEMLNGLAEKGVPIPIRMLAAAGGMDFDKLMASKDQQISDAKFVADLRKSLSKFEPKEETGEGGQEFATMLALAGRGKNNLAPQGILDRNYGDPEAFEPPSLDGRGKRQPKSRQWREEFKDKWHKAIASAAAKSAQRENYIAREAGLLTEGNV